MRCIRGRRALVTFAALAALGTAPAASADTTATSVNLSAGTLDFTTPPAADAFGSATLSGHTQTLRTTFHSWGVSDARGSGAGWNVTLQASRLDDGAGHQLPTGSLQLVAPTTVTPQVGNLAVAPLVQGATFTLDGSGPVKVLSALAATGQGAWDVTQTNLLGGDLVLTVPANAVPGVYSTTITSTLATGP